MSQFHERYPIGQFEKPSVISAEQLNAWIQTIAAFPAKLKAEVITLNDEQLNTPYRQDGWTIRQVVHHTADSHINAFTRFKLTLTEDLPVIKPYDEPLWAELADSKNYPIQSSLLILAGLHDRWTALLHTLGPNELKRCYVHPAHGKHVSLEEAIGMYAWHSQHHLAHITTLKARMNW
ncbi:YfiT family bacillithiol transferase [Filimonas effusa]|uniref:Putative metal-dependent hydrolase n=1 Tax=Filimonas effusa TaxID=2508721 RepID=A0A4Q1DA30_9BACT|nr:bacillithiol transferase BstA [Filimonas effusa]RXK86090.1 putative metal-dependent hydrolase [Filimonas effusa]